MKVMELHACKHCDSIFEREWNMKRQRPSVCAGCNPRLQWKRDRTSETVKKANARYRAKRKERRAHDPDRPSA